MDVTLLFCLHRNKVCLGMGWGWGGGIGGGENHNTRVEERNVKVKHGKDRGLLSGIKLKLLS